MTENPTYLKLKKKCWAQPKTDRTIMRLVSVKRDGGCLFRSLAVALFYHMYGINLGKGQLWGKETTARQIAHNALSRWVRTLIVASLAGHRNVTPHTTFGPMNFVDAMDKAYSILEAFPRRKRLDPRLLREWKRSLAPTFLAGCFDPKAEYRPCTSLRTSPGTC